MIRTNKFLLTLCFALAMGCGDSSSGQSQGAAPQVATASQQAQEAPRQAPQQVAALSGKGAAKAADAAPTTFEEGTHYEKLPRPVPTVDSNRIEVTEIFWYGCSHCFDFEPIFESWKQGVADDVVVEKSPAMWDNQGIMELHARIYYTAKALDALDRISPAAFRALNVDRQPLRSEEDIARLFTDNGVSREDFDRTFKSFGVTSAVRQAEARQRAYRVQGTPEVVVDGTYRISTRMAGSHEGVLRVAEYLIDKVRSERAGD